ncbi:MAG: rod shape-determining protein MreC [Chloroflexaceae bacterium]|jgi:rod shape-determining protein MreC|nr:rod shape-determining protein MreC [Chloroflexaceae bacterium]
MRDYLNDPSLKLRKERSAAATSRRPVVLALLFSALALALLLLSSSGMLGPTRGLAQQALGPVAQTLTAMRDGLGDLFGGFGSGQLQAENEALRQQVSQLEAELLKRNQAQVENIYLRQQLAIQQEKPWKLLGAEVTVRSSDAGRRVMTIARGSDNGVQVGMAVIGQTGTNPAALVGIVEAVGPATADVLLITDFGSQISARVIHDEDSTLGLVRGQWQRGSRLKLEVDRDSAVAIGDAVVSAGLSGTLNLPMPLASVPANIPIGTIEAINSDSYTQVAELRPYVDPDRVRYVWLILP